jgi:hypothetical protein
MANTKLPARLLDTSAIPALNVTGVITASTGVVVQGSGTTAGIYLNGTNSDTATQGNFVRYGTNFATQSNADNSLLITKAFNGSTFVDAITVKSNSNVGIGTNNPLAVLTTDPESGNFSAGYNNYDGVGLFIRGNGTSGNGNYGPALVFGSCDSDITNQTEKHAAISIVQTGTDPNETGLAIWTHPSVTAAHSLVEAMRIDASGDVGIGVTDPADKLEVNGGTAYPHIRITSTNNTSRYMRIGMEDAVNHVIEANGSSTNLKFKTAGADRVVIGSTGNMSITGSLTVSDVRGLTTTNQYLTFGASRSLRIRSSSGGEYLRVSDSAAPGIISVGSNAQTGLNAMGAIHGLANDATLVLSNTDLSDSATTYGWTGRGSRYLHSNGTGWTNSNADNSDGGDPALVIGSSNTSGNRAGIGIALHNESNANNDFSPMIVFGNKSNSGNHNTAYAAIVGKKTGQANDSNWSAGEIHMDTAGIRIGSNTRTAYMDDDPAFKMDEAGDITMPYRSYAYGRWQGSSFSVTNDTGFLMTVLRSQNMTYRNDPTHGFGITIVKPGLYIMNATGLYDPSHTYIYVGWAINGSQVHHWHSNHAISSNHDYVSLAMRQCNTGDHITFENGSQVMTTAWGGAHSAWYIAKFG